MKSNAYVSEQRATVPGVKIPRSQFNLSKTHKTTFDGDYLIPFYTQEVIPGDTFNVSIDAFLRLSTPLYPFMDNLFISLYHFFCPDRLVWTNFKKMMGEQENPADTVDYTWPRITATATFNGEGELYDQLGVNTVKITTAKAINNIKPRMYNLVWNTWFRDENLQNSVTVDLDDGPDDSADYVLLKKNKIHDYFTSALPWPQKTGATEVLMPLGTTAPIMGVNMDFDGVEDAANRASVYDSAGGSLKYLDTTGTNLFGSSSGGGSSYLAADLANASSATINQWRYAEAVQVLYERDARGGTRYVELIWSHFGVENAGGDARQQRPEFLGSSRDFLNVNPIASTYDDATNNTKGQLGAVATGMVRNSGYVKSFTEHGYVMSLICVHGENTYHQGLARDWMYDDKLDMYWPALSQIGEQSIAMHEIYCTGGANDDNVFGYNERDAHHRYAPNTVAGLFRSDATGTLEAWGLWQDLTAEPSLGSTFITCATPIDRVIQTPSEPHIIADFNIRNFAARPLPVYGVPAQVGRF